MNREIKFRAWDTETMLYQDTENCSVFEVLKDGELCIGSETDSTYEGCPFSVVKGSALMQYTGLKDKNGKDIYEGDIVQIGDTRMLYVVEYVSSGFFLVRPSTGYMINIEESSFSRARKVIGNIYENPELLK